jgi:hypothetical protein
VLLLLLLLFLILLFVVSKVATSKIVSEAGSLMDGMGVSVIVQLWHTAGAF